eukprot:TRINITY_DN3525_c0_g1_i1.p1 TRINITY_DN3525_c0_g1~~TRINITY_DN3525_c0_g1_i1.p1  ORF type:complete len:647 (-),score=126.37 TRINITY_DN3525_c0_g1_i1:32-1972(-)
MSLSKKTGKGVHPAEADQGVKMQTVVGSNNNGSASSSKKKTAKGKSPRGSKKGRSATADGGPAAVEVEARPEPRKRKGGGSHSHAIPRSSTQGNDAEREKEKAAELHAKKVLNVHSSSTYVAKGRYPDPALVRELLTKEPPAQLSELMEPKVSIYDWVDLPDKLLVKPMTSMGRFVQISGPEGGFDAEEVMGAFAAGATINNYPMVNVRDGVPGQTPMHLGHPIADYFLARLYANRSLLALGDGCGWGRPAAEASCIAANTFLSYLTSKMKEIISVRDAGRLILRAFSEAHNKILGSYNDIWEAGTTTMLAGLILEVDLSAWEDGSKEVSLSCSAHAPQSTATTDNTNHSNNNTHNNHDNSNNAEGQQHNTHGNKDKGKERATRRNSPDLKSSSENGDTEENPYRWVFVCASVGDGKALHYSGRTKEVTDITHGNRSDLRGATDPGGRLGAMVGGGDPDLRNLFIHFVPCQEGDYIILMSDGVHDNLDPVTCGVTPASVGLDAELYPKWDKIPDLLLLEAKRAYLKRQVEQLINMNNDNSDNISSSISPKESPSFTPREKEEEHDNETSHATTTTTNATPTPLAPASIANNLVNLARVMCKNSVEWMQKTPDIPLPIDYERFPGKMDHATCLVLHVGHHHFCSMHK